MHCFAWEDAEAVTILIRFALGSFGNATGLANRNRKVGTSKSAFEWGNIERILLSLALKSTSQSVIVSKLSSHRRQNRTKQALWEFEHIIRSLYLLDYVDSPLLRRNVHRALNRGEAYHRMRRAIAYAHGGRFRVRSQHEQELWNECTRLIANAVVY